MISKRRSAGIIAALALVAASLAPTLSTARAITNALPRYQHIFIIMMENHGYGEIIGNTASAPYINSLATTYGLATNSYGVTHPSEPNYVASIGGSYFGIQDDKSYTATTPVNHTLAVPSVADQLTAAGLTWKTYQQALPYAGYTGTRWPLSGPTLYASKHNPFLNFASTQSGPALQNIVPDTQLATDLQSGKAPSLSYIVPDQCHDMHGTPPACPYAVTTGDANDQALIAAGDGYVKQTVQAIMASSAWDQGNSAIVVTWDEDDFSPTDLGCCNANPGGGHVATIVLTNVQGENHVVDATPYNHYSLLQTIQQAFGLGCLQNTCDTTNVRPMTALFGQNGNGQ